MRKIIKYFPAVVLMILVSTAVSKTVPLKEAFENQFYIGVAVNDSQVSGADKKAQALIISNFNSITPENCMKWDTIHPQPDVYSFEQADRFVEFGEQNNMVIIGHILIDRAQTPGWVFQDRQGNTIDRQTLLKRMHDHITTVVGRYKGRVHCWHVVNEPIANDGSFANCKWLEIIGEDYITKAFEYAHEADPNVELYYNGRDVLTDSAIDSNLRLAGQIKKTSRIDGIGIQAHWSLDDPSAESVEQGITRLARSNLKLMITEMDITVLPRSPGSNLNPYPDKLPDEIQQRLADRYAELFSVFCRYSDKIYCVNLWGLDDGQTWLNYWPIAGRTDYPLLFDRNLKPKPAYFAVIDIAEKYNK